MLFNLNEFLRAVYFALDFVEIDILGVTSNHGKRAAFTSLKIAKEMGLSRDKLHDIGKLAIPNNILDSPNKLTSVEFDIVKKHSYYTRQALQEISGFEDITEWASNHHEKLNGRGYPFGKTSEELDFNSRLIACLDIYEALTEERPYRRALSHLEAMEILNKMKEEGVIDREITKDIEYVFSK